MSKESFEAFKKQTVEENEARYGAEIREKYGDEAVDASNAKLMGLSETEYLTWTALGAQIQTSLAQAVRAGADPSGEAGTAIASLHRKWLSYTWKQYSPRAHRGLAEMYVADERFTAHYDSAVPGCAQFLRDAIVAAAAED